MRKAFSSILCSFFQYRNTLQFWYNWCYSIHPHFLRSSHRFFQTNSHFSCWLPHPNHSRSSKNAARTDHRCNAWRLANGFIRSHDHKILQIHLPCKVKCAQLCMALCFCRHRQDLQNKLLQTVHESWACTEAFMHLCSAGSHNTDTICEEARSQPVLPEENRLTGLTDNEISFSRCPVFIWTWKHKFKIKVCELEK